jgi:hypothetical protein
MFDTVAIAQPPSKLLAACGYKIMSVKMALLVGAIN